MVLRLLEGFETKRAGATKLSRLYSASGSIGGFVSGRKTGFGLSAQNYSLLSGQLVDPDENTWVVGFALKKISNNTVGASADAGIHIHNDSGEQCKLVMIQADNGHYQMQLKRDTVVIDTTSAVAFPPGNKFAWQYFQLKVTVRTGANGIYELRHYDRFGNSTVVMSGSGVNLAHQAVDGADRIRMSWFTDGGGNVVIDDVVAMDSSGLQNNDFMGAPAVVLGALPDGDGNQNDWVRSEGATNWETVDDAPTTGVDDGGQVTSQSVGDVDLYTYQDFATVASAATVLGVQVVSSASMASSGNRTLRVRVRESAAEATGDNFGVSTLVLDSFRQMFDLNPTGTPAAWTKASLEGAEFGIEVQA